MNQVWLAFVTGLTTGGISCFAVQGGLLASAISQQSNVNQKKLVGYFLTGKVIAYTLLGVLLGTIGSALVISPKLQGYMQILAGLFMFISVGKLLDIHPIFRRFTFTPPKHFFRIARKASVNENTFAPLVLGALTILIPCGITQSMMLLSVASGNSLQGGLILGAFILGTSPVFFGLGIASSQILRRKSLKYVAATAVFVLGVVAVNTGQVLRGSKHTLQNYWTALTDSNLYKEEGKVASANSEGVQEVEIAVLSSGYKSNVNTLKVGMPVSIKLTTDNTQGCSRAFTIPEYNISKILPPTGTLTVDFTPTKTGRLTYTCSMGMYTGYFNVI